MGEQLTFGSVVQDPWSLDHSQRLWEALRRCQRRVQSALLTKYWMHNAVRRLTRYMRSIISEAEV